MSFTRRGVPCLIAALLLLPGVPARAEAPRLAVAVVSQDPDLEGEALAATQLLEERLQKDERYTLVSLQQRAWATATRERASRGERGRAILAQAMESFDALEMSLAVQRVGEASNLLEESDLEHGASPLLDALAFKALLSQVLGPDSDLAGQQLERLFALAPAYAFKPARANPRFSALAEGVRSRVASSERGSLELQLPKGHALAYVDGVFRCVAPCSVEGLMPGMHYVTLLAPGSLPFQEMTRAGEGQIFRTSLAPSPEGAEVQGRLHGIAEAMTRGGIRQAGPDFARWAGTENVLLVTLARKNGGLEVTAARLGAPGTLPLEASRTLAGTPAALEVATFAVSLLDQKMTAAPHPEVAATIPSSTVRPPSLTWVMLGASAATAAGGLLMGQSTVKQVSRAESVPQVDQGAYQRAYAIARNRAIGADALYGASLASAGVAVWLFLTGLGHGGPAPISAAPSALHLEPLPGGAVLSFERTLP